MAIMNSMRGSILQRLTSPLHMSPRITLTMASKHSQRMPRPTSLGTSATGIPNDPDMDSWDSATTKMVALSAAPFSIIGIPQVMQNFAAISAGNAAAIGIISWEGIITTTLGNTLMGAHFAAQGEGGALNVQLVSILNNLLILSQVAYTGHMPTSLFVGAVGAAALAAGINVSRANGWLPKSWDSSWSTYQLGMGVLGLGVMPQVMYTVMYPQAPSIVPGVGALAAATIWLAASYKSKSAKEFQGLVSALPGTAATLLFCLAPMPQLIKNFMDPVSCGGLSIGSLVLALLGNALMFPRALKTKDPIWLVGSTWANVAGWLTLLSLVLGHSVETGLSFVDPRVFAAITTVMVTFFTGVLIHNKRIQGHASVAASLKEIFFGGKAAIRP